MAAIAPSTSGIVPGERVDRRAQVRAYATPAALLAIMLLAALLRFTGQNWDSSQNLHPDERFITMVATGIRWPSSLGEYFDTTRNPLNPYNNSFPTFIYGSFPLYLDKLYGDITGQNVYGNFHLASRTMSAVFDLLTVFFLFLIGRRFFNEKVGLLAALLYSLSVLPIQLSHFGTFDLYASTLCVMAFYFASRANDNGRWWEFIVSGIMVGLAVASKLSALPIAAVLAIPLIEQLRLHGPDAFWYRKGRTGLPVLLGVLLAGFLAFWTFRIFQPFAFQGPGLLGIDFNPQWTQDVAYWRGAQSGEIDGNPSTQWANRSPLFILQNFVIWGVGPALGIVSLVALGLAAVRLFTARRWPPTWQLFLVVWPGFYLFYYSVQFIKTMRYTVPAYPFMALLAAALLVEIWAQIARRWPRWDWAGPLPMALVVLLTAAYAFAFTSIYTRDQPRVAASMWIYQNIPQGTTVLNEHWDDGLPLNLPGQVGSGAYPGTELTLYDDDNPEKLAKIVDLLRDNDYIFVTSNRLYGSIPRIPERWPMTVEYYDMLFSGELGFDLVHTETNYPSLFGFELNDDSSEESFTVYDHPKVYIFQKNPDTFDIDAIQTRLAAQLSGDIVRVKTVDAGKNMLLMSDEERQIQQAGGTWSAIFDRGSLTNQHPVIAWYLALQLMALAAIPLCWRALRRLPDRGYAAAKSAGLALSATFGWLLASLHLVDWGRPGVLIGIIGVALLSVLASAGNWRQIGVDLRASWRWIVAAELIFLAAFLVFVYVRSVNPDLWHPARGGEKPMEFAYFNAIIKSTHFPAYDPWFAGGYINYYYFGWVLFAALAHLTGIIPAVSFNLAVATVFGLAILNAWSFVASALTFFARHLRFRSDWYPIGLGLLGSLFVGILGNLDMARRFGVGEMGFPPVSGGGILALGSVGDIVRGTWRAFADFRMAPLDAYWTPTRIIDGTVNEFPYFSFLFADLHPHMMAIPFSLLTMVIALGVMASRMWSNDRPAAPETGYPVFGIAGGLRTWIGALDRRSILDRFWLILLAGMITGMLYPLNTWDYPTYVAIIAGSFLLLDLLGSAVSANWGRDLDWRPSFSTLRRAIVSAAAIVLIGRLLYLPYFANYQSQIAGFDPWTQPQSTASQYLIIHGFFLFVIVSYLVIELLQTMRPVAISGSGLPGIGLLRGSSATGIVATGPTVDSATNLAISPAWFVIAAAGIVFLLAVWTGAIMLLFLALLILIAGAAYQRQRDPARLFLLGMITVAVALGAAVENYTLRGDIGRMNTVFKFYLQAWALYGLAAAVALVFIVRAFRRWIPITWSLPWAIVFTVLLASTLVYPVYATRSRLDDRFTDLPRTLDGMAYMPHATYVDGPDGGIPQEMDLAQDYEALIWMQDNIQGSPVVLEAWANLYRWGSRVSVYTGLPTVIGWDWHQRQQRPGFGPLVDIRRADVDAMFDAARTFQSIRPLLDKYHVQYIYIGPLERIYYGDDGVAKFAQAASEGLLTPVYDQNGVTIYRYLDPAE